jgi:hypothetical protein
MQLMTNFHYVNHRLLASSASKSLAEQEVEQNKIIMNKQKIFHECEECRLLGREAVWLLQEPTFRRNLAPPSLGWQESVN